MTQEEAAISKLFEAMNDAWSRGDAQAYAASLTEDADYVAFDGTRLRGRDENARVHQALYQGLLRDSRLWGQIESIAFLGDDVALVHGVGGVIWPWQQTPSAAARSRQTTVVVRRDGGWLVRAFQNTRVRPLPPPAPNSLALRLFRAWVWLRTRLARAPRARTAAALAIGVIGVGAGALAVAGAAPKDGRRELLSAQAGIVEAPVDRVADLVARSFEAQRPHVRTVEVDPVRRTFATQGGWWFRGECQLEPHPRGTLVVYRVFNVARTRRWMVPLVLLQYRLSGQLAGMYDVSGMVQRLGQQLAAPAYVINASSPG